MATEKIQQDDIYFVPNNLIESEPGEDDMLICYEIMQKLKENVISNEKNKLDVPNKFIESELAEKDYLMRYAIMPKLEEFAILKKCFQEPTLLFGAELSSLFNNIQQNTSNKIVDENCLKHNKILKKLEDEGVLNHVTQLLNASDLFNVMLASKTFLKRVSGSLEHHLNRVFIAEFSHEFDRYASRKVMVFDCFKLFCACHGDYQDRTPIQCSELLMQKDTEKCKTQLQKFVQTLQPDVIKSFLPQAVNNLLEYPNHETVIFNIQYCKTKRLSSCMFHWKYKLFPIMISYQNKDFVFHFGIDKKQSSQRHPNPIRMHYWNASGDLKIDFDEINFSNGPPTFLIRDAKFQNSEGSEKILPLKAMLLLFRGLWCDVKQLEEFSRMQEIKSLLIPNSFQNCYHNEITFPQDDVLEYRKILSSSSETIFSLVWKQAKFPLVIKDNGKGFVFTSIKQDRKYQKWTYMDVAKVVNRKYSEAIIIFFPPDAQFPVEQQKLGNLAVKAISVSIFDQNRFEKRKAHAATLFNEGIWFDIKFIKKEIKEFLEQTK